MEEEEEEEAVRRGKKSAFRPDEGRRRASASVQTFLRCFLVFRGAATQWQRQLPQPAEPDEHDRNTEVWMNGDLRVTQQTGLHGQEMRLDSGSENLGAPF